MDLVIYANKKTARLIYTLEVIFKWMYPIEYQLTNDIKLFNSSDAAKLNYSDQSISSDVVHLSPDALLFETSISTNPPASLLFREKTAFFPNKNPNSALPFDPLACIFYWISRYEEYLPFEADQYGRFRASESLAFKHQLLNLPAAQYWASLLFEKIREQFPAFPQPDHHFHFQPTFDIDLAWAYLHRPLWRTLGRAFNSFAQRNWSLLKEQFSVILGYQQDPYFTFDLIDHLHELIPVRPIYFFLLGDYGKYDTNVSPNSSALQQLIKNRSTEHTVGIHPSFASNSRPTQLSKEIERLHQIIDQPVMHSRQHFLMLRFPDTYRNLLANGIQHDYSMGFADMPGFRAGMALPYPWFDLLNNKPTKLIIHPFQVMDVTLKSYLALSPEEALHQLKNLVNTLQQYSGILTPLWHNSSFANMEGWDGWEEVYREFVQHFVNFGKNHDS